MSTTPIPIDQFAAAIRAKHPGAYDNRSDAELVQAYINKYPVYKDKVAGFAETNFEKQRTPQSDSVLRYIGGAASSLGNAALGILSGGVPSPSAVIPTPGKVADIALADAARQQEGRSLPYRALAGATQTTGILDPTAQEDAAAHGDTARVAGLASGQTAAALSPYIAQGASALRSKISNAAYTNGALNPRLAAVGDALEHPTTIPGKLVKGTASALFPPPESAPVYPGAMLPSIEDFYANRGAEINAANKQMAQVAKAQAKIPNWETPAHDIFELGSPEYPGPMSKVPNRVAPQFRGDPFAPPVSNTPPSPYERPVVSGSEPLVVTPSEAASLDQLQAIAEQRARERGMQYAGGVRTAGKNKVVNRLFPPRTEQ